MDTWEEEENSPGVNKRRKDRRVKFESFTDRIKRIRIDLLPRSDLSQPVPSERETFFFEGVLKWKELNLTADFSSYLSQIRDRIQTLPLLLHNRDFLLEVTITAISEAAEISLEPVLDLSVQLARDLQQDFSPHFPRLFSALTGRLGSRDAGVLELVFSCLSHLLKILWRHLLAESELVCSCYAPLLSSARRDYVQRFAAESLSFLLRRSLAHSQAETLSALLKITSEDTAGGMGSVLFEMMKGPHPHFHSCAPSLLGALLGLLDTETHSNTSELATAFLRSLIKTSELMVLHSSVETAQECIGIILDKLSESSGLSDASLRGLVEVGSCWVGPDRSRLSKESFERCVGCLSVVCRSIGGRRESWECCMRVFVRLSRTNERFKLVDTPELWRRVGEVLRGVNSREEWSVEAACGMVEGMLAQNADLFSNVLPFWIEMSETILAQSSPLVDRVLYSWTQVLTSVTEEGGAGEKRIKLDSSDPFGASLLLLLLERSTLPLTPEGAPHLSCLCLYTQRVSAPPETALLQIEASLEQLFLMMTSRDEALLTTLRDCVQTLVRSRDLSSTFPPPQLLSLLSQFPDSPSLLQAADTYTRQATLPQHLSEQIRSHIIPTLSSPFSHTRAIALSVLSSLSPRTATLSVCCEAERTGADVTRYRERLGQLRRLAHTPGGGRGGEEVEICLRVLVSQFYINFSPIWEQVRPLVTSYALEETSTVFWKVFSTELEESEHSIEEDGSDLSHTPNSVNKWFLSRENGEKERRRKARIDRGNYSLQLWRTLLQIPGRCESRSRELVPILTRFLERWFVPREALQEIGRRGTSEKEGKPSNHSMNSRRKQITLAMLELFSHFKHPKSLYRADALRELYLRLLSHPISEIQTSALSCLVSFQLPHLHAYLDPLTAVATESQLCSSLTLFSSEASEVCLLAEEHRAEITPILCRLLHGLLLRHGSSERPAPAQTAILQFLASCSGEELSSFLSLALSPLQPILHGQWTMDTSEQHVLVVPLKKQMSFLTLLKHLFFSLSTQIPERYLADILTLLFNTCAQCVSLLKNRDSIQPWAIPLLKSIRSLAISRITDVSLSFPSDVITSREEELFSSLITPSLSHSPSQLAQGGPLLELLHAWSSETGYAQLFQRDLGDQVTVIGYVINTLEEKGVNKRGADCILEMVSLLLQQETEGMVAPHIEKVLGYINQVLTAARRERRALSVHCREMEILSLASKWIGRKEADVLTENLTFFLTSRGSHQNQITCDILTSVRNLIPLVAAPEKVSSKLCSLFSQLSGREERQELLAVFSEIAERLPYVQLAVSISRKLNAWREGEIEGIDFALRGEGFSLASEGLREGRFEEESLRILAHNCIHFLFYCEELSLRDMSVQFLQSLIEWDYVDIYRGVISRCVLSAVKRGLKSRKESTRSESVGLLACITKRFPQKAKFSELLSLASKDREVDVFENLVHIQLHRRTAAVAKLTKLAESNTFSPLTLRQYLIPLVGNFLRCSQRDREHNLLSNAIQFMGRAAGQMGWGQYSNLLRSYLRMVTAASCQLDESVVIRVIIAVIQNFHFDASSEEASLGEKGGESGSENEHVSDAAATKSNRTIQEIMSKQILPELEELLNTGPGSKSGGHRLSQAALNGCEIRAPIALALVQLLGRLPPEVWGAHFPGVLLKLVRALHSREWERRQEVRGVLREVAATAGAGLLRGMFAEMQQQLNRGYQVHVLAYSIHSVLEGVKRKLRPGDLDPCVPILSEVILNDLFGRPSEEREVREIAVKTLEVKHPKALDIVELLSSFLSPGAVSALLGAVAAKLHSASGAQVERVRDVLKRLSQGVLRNRAMTSHKLLLFIHQQLTASLSKVSGGCVREETPSGGSKYLGEVRRDCYLIQDRVERGGLKPQVAAAANIQVLTEFCLGLLSSALRADRKVDLRQQSVQEMLDPFIETLSGLLPTPHLRICTLSVRILGQVSHLPLPSLERHTRSLKQHLFSHLGRFGRAGRDADSPSGEMVSACFRVLSNLLGQGGVAFSKEELQTLLVSVEEDIHHTSRHASVFPLLKALIASGAAGRALHQLMLRVASLSVQEESEGGRRHARASLLLFLTERPIGRKRLKRCLDSVLGGLEYEAEPGRQSAARLTALILRRFPREILTDLAEYFYLPLALALANEESRGGRRLLQLALKALFSRVDSSRLDNIYQMGWGWIVGADSQFVYMGVTSLFVLIESGVGVVSKKMDVILKRLVRIVKHKRENEDTFSNRIELVCVECLLKMLRVHGVAVLCQKNSSFLSELIECCIPLVNAEDKEVRVVTDKLFGSLFAQTKRGKHSNIALFRSKDQLVRCAQVSVDRINSSEVEGEEAKQVVRNLIHLSGLLLGGGELSTLKYLVRQMVKKATLEAVLHPRQVTKRRSTYQLIAALSVGMEREVLSGSLGKLVKPLFYEVSRGSERGRRVGPVTQEQEEVKGMAQECLDIIKKKVGAEVFNRHLLKLQKKAGEIRVKRKSVRSQLAATDPVRFANMKLRKHSRQSLARKRKVLSRKPFKPRQRKLQ